MDEAKRNHFGSVKRAIPLIQGNLAPFFLLALLIFISGCATSEGEDPMSNTNEAEVGSLAPEFSLPDQNGATVSLKDFQGKSVVVLYFYPKDNTSVCTAQACGFRDNYESFKESGAVVIGISSDPVESHEGFAAEYQLPFYLLSDVDGKVRDRYGATGILGIPGRVTFVIDKQGVVRHKFSSMFSADKHIQEALEVIKTLNQ
jgi:peroxiredoxin Q/BCP